MSPRSSPHSPTSLILEIWSLWCFSEASNCTEKGSLLWSLVLLFKKILPGSPAHLPPCTVHRLPLHPSLPFLSSSSFLLSFPPSFSSPSFSSFLPRTKHLRGRTVWDSALLCPPQPSHRHLLALNFLIPAVSSTSEITGSALSWHTTWYYRQTDPASSNIPFFQHENLSSTKRTGLILPNPTSQAEPHREADTWSVPPLPDIWTQRGQMAVPGHWSTH